MCVCVREWGAKVDLLFPLPIHLKGNSSWAVGIGGGSQVGVESGQTGLTNGHETHDQLGVGDIGTSHSGPTDSLADIRVHAAHLI